MAKRAKSFLVGSVEQIPKEYAQPIRNTQYLMSYPHVLHAGKMLSGEEREFPSVLNWNLPRNDRLTNLLMRSEVDYTTSRVVDARGVQAVP